MQKSSLSRFFVLSLVLLISSAFSAKASGDTTVVQTFNFGSTSRSGMFQFPDDTTKRYEKIIMLYRMRCKNGLVSTSTNRNLGCGEWDYNCYTYLIDSSMTDSVARAVSDYQINGFSGTTFQYTSQPQYNLTFSEQQQVTYTSVNGETSVSPGSGAAVLNHPFATGSQSGRMQYLWTAAELSAAGFTAGDINGLGIDLGSSGALYQNLRIRVRHTAQDSLNALSPEIDGFTEVYFLNTDFPANGLQRFNFHTPFNWDGTSNLLLEFIYTGVSGTGSCLTTGEQMTDTRALVNTASDGYLETSGGPAVIDIPAAVGNNITGAITIAFWCYGDTARIPANTSIFEALDAAGRRQLNLHLPWSNGSVYWDCGNDGTGYDRINKAATTAETEGRWNHWAVTKDVTTGSMKIYLNGQLWHSGTGNVRPISIAQFKLGRSVSNNYTFFGGMDDFSVWNAELTQSQVQEIMFSNITAAHPAYANLQVYYPMDNAGSGILDDAGPNGYDATQFAMTPRLRKARELFRNFSPIAERPYATFYRGTYTTSIQTIPSYDSTLIAPSSVVALGTDNANNLIALDTNFVWPAGIYTYTSSEAGVLLDSVLVLAEDSIIIDTLFYYEKRPAKVELIDFITPYGIGLDMDGLNGKTWAFDVTDYAPVLRGNKFMSMEGAGRNSEDNDITFLFIEGTPPRDVISLQNIWPNGTWGEVNYGQILANTFFEPREINLSPDAAQYKIRSSVSGHGQEGEFIQRVHTLRMNNSVNFSRPVWSECATNPIYPQGGTWVYDRAGWCPGAAVDLKEYELSAYVTPGQTVTLDHTLPNATNTGDSRYRINNQLISYGPTNFSLDARLNYIKSPTNRVEYTRLNPVCNQPVTLPQPNWLSSNSSEFIAVISNPNGGSDQYSGNDTLINTFNYTAVYTNSLVVEVRTNNNGTHTSYSLRDSQGNLIVNRLGLAANTVYRDTLNLPTDCYTFYLNDLGDDGLSWWANSGQGTGYCRLKNAATGAIIRTFNSDFGDNIYQQFTVNYALPVNELPAGDAGPLHLYPNPASTQFTAEFTLPYATSAVLEVRNTLGQLMLSQEVNSTDQLQRIVLDAEHLQAGMYTVALRAGNAQSVQRISIFR
ncbi:MAG: T9SS type A sorting domain-containing protein [Sphingobacteriales bacterium]|nr:T9SS type A sorting domain-containing protein [Sphingobacteriales bacterium]